MKIHEYQAKQILRRYGVSVPDGALARTPDEAEGIARDLGGTTVVKAQIHAGGRGKAGGIRLAKTPEEARKAASEIIGMNLVTHQTGPASQKVKSTWLEQATDVARELYLGIVLDRAHSRLVVMASPEGGMDIEEVAARTPGKILREIVHPGVGLLPYQARKIALGLGLEIKEAVPFITALYQAYLASDCTMVEINPLACSRSGKLLALDAKMTFDDSALDRHPDIKDLRDPDEEDPLEVEASRFSLSYIKLEGEIGCMVNGAGLAMATMDIVKHAGSSPANFLDVGGSTTVEGVRNAFRILTSDPQVKAVFVNIFGGIVRCDRVAEGLVQALNEKNIQLPMVVRLQGTHAVEGEKILEHSGLPFTVARELEEAAHAVVRAVRGTE